MVTPLSRRRRQVLAKHLMTLDHLSGGRVTLGVGLGDPPDLDFSDFGDEPSYRVRAAITDEALTVLGGPARRGAVAHHGDHLDGRRHHAAAAGAAPRIPIWVAGRAPPRQPLERARRWDGYVPIAAGLPDPRRSSRPTSGRTPHDDWDLVAQWPDGTSAEEYAAAGATWLVRSVWPHEEGWRDELEGLVSAPPVLITRARSPLHHAVGEPHPDLVDPGVGVQVAACSRRLDGRP